MKYTHVVTFHVVTDERVSEKVMAVMAVTEAWLAGGVAAGQFESARAVGARRQIFDLGSDEKGEGES